MAEKAPTFEELYQRDIKKYVEKLRKTYKDKRTGQEKYFELSYLSWAYGHREMKRIDPNAKEEVVEFPMVVQGHKIDGVKVPYLHTPQGYFVKCNVTINGRTESEWLPVLDNSNRPIDNPTSFQINTSHKRCFVKALAKHGLGLYLYVGEDLPEDITSKEVETLNNAKPTEQTQVEQQSTPKNGEQHRKLIEDFIRDSFQFFKEKHIGGEAYMNGLARRMNTKTVYDAPLSVVVDTSKQWKNELMEQAQQPQPTGGKWYDKQ